MGCQLYYFQFQSNNMFISDMMQTVHKIAVIYLCCLVYFASLNNYKKAWRVFKIVCLV